LTPKAKEKLFVAINDAINLQLLRDNKNVVERVNAINKGGRWDAAHAKALSDLYTNAANRLLGPIAAPMIREMVEMTQPGRIQRQQKVAAQVARRDPGASSGAPAAPKVAGINPVIKPGMSQKDIAKAIFDAADARAVAAD
jgi:hypothetical protein